MTKDELNEGASMDSSIGGVERSVEIAKAMIEKAMLEGSYSFEWTHIHSDGTEFPATVALSRVETTEKVFLLVNLRDRSEQKRDREALQKERNILRTLIDDLPDAIYVKNNNCRKTIANKADLHNMGLETESEVLGKNDFDLFPPEVAAAFYADDQLVIQSGHPVLRREEFFFDRDGNKNWLLTSIFPSDTFIPP